RERSTSPAGHSASNRRRYLYSVWREIPSSRHNAVTFTGTPLENTASSFASIDTTFCSTLHSIERQLDVSDVPQQELSAITRETTAAMVSADRRSRPGCRWRG